MKCRGLRRNAGGLEIGMGDANHLPRTERPDMNGIAETIRDGSGIGNHISCLGMNVIGISRVEETVVVIYKGNPAG